MSFSDKDLHELLSLCTDFRHAIEKAKMNHDFNGACPLKNFPYGSCGYTCELLHEYLNEYRIPTYYIWGSDLSGQTHAWLALAETVQVYYESLPTNYLEIIAKYDPITQSKSIKHYNLDNSIIIDITGDQFKDKSEYYNFSEAVYIGEPTRFHRLFHIDEPANICENPSTDMYVLMIIKGYLQQHRTNAD